MNKNSLDKLVDYYFEPQGVGLQPNSLNFGNLLNFIMEEYQKLAPELEENAKKRVLLEKLEEKIIKFPKIKITERWGEKQTSQESFKQEAGS